MARLDELAHGIASVLKATGAPEPLPVDLVNETPAAAALLVRAIVDSCARQAAPLIRVAVDPILGETLLREHGDSYEGVAIVGDAKLSNRIELFRFHSS
jgi:hypothetical protein